MDIFCILEKTYIEIYNSGANNTYHLRNFALYQGKLVVVDNPVFWSNLG